MGNQCKYVNIKACIYKAAFVDKNKEALHANC